MKIKFFLINSIILSFSQLIAQNTTNDDCDYPATWITSQVTISQKIECDNPWTLVFEDEFDGTELDQTKWTPITGYIRNYDVEKEYYLPENIEVSNGTLKLWTKKEVPPVTYEYTNLQNYINYTDNFDYTSAEIDSKMPFNFKFGKFEIKCKVPYGKGIWPAFWLFGGPRYNEIDVFEFLQKPIAYFSMAMTHHYDVYNNNVRYSWTCQQKNISEDFYQSWHKYTLIWDEYEMLWYLDDILMRKVSRYYFYSTNGDAINPCNTNPPYIGKEELVYPKDPMNVIANVAVYIGNDAPEATTQFPVAMEIDYIRVWQRDKGCCIPYKLYEATNNLPSSTHVSNYIAAGNDAGISDVGGNVTINENQDVAFTAGNYIDLLPGFSVERGATFNASIEDCSPLNQPEGEDITVTNFPDDFTDKLCVSVNGATKYTIRVEFDNGNTIYYSQNNPINTNPVCVWDGSCNYGSPNCWLYVRCPRSRKVIIDFSNCSKSVSQTKTVHVSCSEKNLQLNDSLNQDLTDNRNFENYNFIISPNPTSGIFTLSCTNTKFSAEISDFLNRKILSSSSIEGFIQFDLSSFPKGIYIVKASTSDGQIYTDKIIYQ
ncbi:MAG: family 16 glycosylhydrolase [Bacteroidales bacterium]|nr:family 16 glycosylhydrolase [Bacteroidales bacterium]